MRPQQPQKFFSPLPACAARRGRGKGDGLLVQGIHKMFDFVNALALKIALLDHDRLFCYDANEVQRKQQWLMINVPITRAL
jgi:hypothetical protein